MESGIYLGWEKDTLFRKVSSVQRLKCMESGIYLGWERDTLFREVSSVQGIWNRGVPLYRDGFLEQMDTS